MDHEKRQAHLQQLFDECCTDDSSEEDPYQTDGDDDSNYIMENLSSSEDDVDSDEESVCIDSDGEANENIDSETDDVEADENDKDWHETVSEIPNFNFDSTSSGIKIEISDTSFPIDVFNQIINNNIMDLLIRCTNEY